MWICNSKLELINTDRINKIVVKDISPLEQKVMDTTDKAKVVGLVFDGSEECSCVMIESFSDEHNAWRLVIQISYALKQGKSLFQTDEWCDDDGNWHTRENDLA